MRIDIVVTCDLLQNRFFLAGVFDLFHNILCLVVHCVSNLPSRFVLSFFYFCFLASVSSLLPSCCFFFLFFFFSFSLPLGLPAEPPCSTCGKSDAKKRCMQCKNAHCELFVAGGSVPRRSACQLQSVFTASFGNIKSMYWG